MFTRLAHAATSTSLLAAVDDATIVQTVSCAMRRNVFATSFAIVVAAAACVAPALAGPNDSICDYLETFNTCFLTTTQSACTGNCVWSSGACTVDSSYDAYTASSTGSDTKSQEFKAAYDTCQPTTAIASSAACAAASDDCDWDGSDCTLPVSYWEDFAVEKCGINTSPSSAMSPAFAVTAVGLAVAALA